MRLISHRQSSHHHPNPPPTEAVFFTPINTLSKNKLTFVLHALLTYVIIQPIAAHKAAMGAK